MGSEFRWAVGDRQREARRARAAILELVRDYHKLAFPREAFVPGASPYPVGGRVFDADELVHLTDAALDMWLTTGRFAQRFEGEFSAQIGVRHATLVNSGSSANLLAVSALTSPTLGDRRLRPGDEVITAAVGFPTTVNPIIQNRLVPVFVDVEPATYNIDPTQLEAAVSDRTRAVMVAHTLGNPFDLDAVMRFARQHGLWVIEDCCDALGSTYRDRKVGTFGDMATFSFYPGHHVTMGEGGCVLTDNQDLQSLVRSFRDWGRDCWCEPGEDNACGRRFAWRFGDATSYDHKYIYSHIGFNLKPTDMQAAVGVAQLKKLDRFCAARRRNFMRLRAGLRDLERVFALPVTTPNSEPAWFGFPIGVRPKASFSREELVQYLERSNIGTRLLFGGDLTQQPAYREIEHRAIGKLPVADFVLRQVFWIGVYPGLEDDAIDWVLDVLHGFVEQQ